MLTLDTATLRRLKAYCVIDVFEPGDKKLLDRMYNAAVDYMTTAGVAMPPAGTARRAQYDSCIDALVLQDWDNRGTQTSSASIADNPAFRRRLNQLKQSEPVSELDTGSRGGDAGG